MKHLFFGIALISLITSCAQANGNPESSTEVKKEAMTPASLDSLQTAYFASGCFWCVEAVFESVEGVHEAVSGYAGGDESTATYGQVSGGRTDHAETVKVYYDSSVVSFETLVDVFFASHDPSTLNRQGPDSGTQYRSIAFYQTNNEKSIIKAAIQEILDDGIYRKVTTQVESFESFYEAEDYHQDYERRNPNQGYVQAVSIPRLNAFKRKMPEVLKESAKLH